MGRRRERERGRGPSRLQIDKEAVFSIRPVDFPFQLRIYIGISILYICCTFTHSASFAARRYRILYYFRIRRALILMELLYSSFVVEIFVLSG